MSDTISQRTAELAFRAIASTARNARRNGQPVPADVKLAAAELYALATRTRHEFVAAQGIAPPYEQVCVGTAAQRLGISVRQVQRRCAAGTLPAVRVGRRTWQVLWQLETV